MKRFYLLFAICLITAGIAAASTARQGGSFELVLSSAEGVAAGQVRFLQKNISFFPAGPAQKAIVGIPCELKPGNYPLILHLTKQDGSTEERRGSVKVARTKFPTVSFWLKPAKKKLLARDIIGEEWALIERVLVREDPAQHWVGKFIRPTSGEVSMVFGTQEYINRKKRGQHRGFDIAVPIGTRVKAANNGKVVFAQKLTAFGGTIVVDHGQGVHTLYFHLSKFLAPVGQTISKGDIIALSGNSGISSGPHLHWGMSVHNLRVDPNQWTKYAF
ncbi:MAG: M23 family metallopeptidase [Candidatus Margulisiibacteriota bacterium]